MPEALRDRLEALAVDDVGRWQQLALVRLHLFVTGETHRLLKQFLDNLRPDLDEAADEEGNLDVTALPGLTTAAQRYWQGFVANWLQMVQAARRQAAWIPFGQLARLHLHYFADQVGEGEAAESGPGARILREDGPTIGVGYPDEPGPIDRVRPFVFDHAGFILRAIQARIDGILNGAEAIKYSDGKSFSDRVWSLEHGGLQGILAALQLAAAEGQSAWSAAKDLEQYLGFGRDCPRWTWKRLYVLTKTDIALGDETGLVRNPCDGRGVAYAALRLARNEVQIVHHIATDRTFAAMPWIENEQIVLSPSHPPIGCECEDVVAGGEKGDGVYPKGEIVLPIHIQCIPEGQKIGTIEGNRRIEDVRIGNLVLTHRGRYRPVVQTFVRWHEGELVKITTRGGRQILVTPDHPVLAGGMWKAASELEVGDGLLVLPSDEVVGDQHRMGGNQ